MYLSGAPLHVITLTLTGEFRRAVCAEFPISFSAGVDRRNFANMVACGFVPVTTCTDLLRTGGYGRLPPYLHDLRTQMERVGARTIDDFVLDCRGQRESAGGDPVKASFLNTQLIVGETQADPRYHAAQNRGVPKKIGTHLVTFDCITCDKCIPVCPNDANFLYHTGKPRLLYRNIEVLPDGSVAAVGDQRVFELTQAEQIANYADYCNHCGNCDTFCPEYDGPYLKKPNFYGSRRAFEAGAPHDGYLLEGTPGALSLVARIDGHLYQLTELAGGDGYRYDDGAVQIVVGDDGTMTLDAACPRPQTAYVVDIGRFHAIATLLRGIIDTTHIHAVNAPLLAATQRRSISD
jgi:putative selenate reductase